MPSRGPSPVASFSSLSYRIFPVALVSERRFTAVYACVHMDTRRVRFLIGDLLTLPGTGEVLHRVLIACVVFVHNQPLIAVFLVRGVDGIHDDP